MKVMVNSLLKARALVASLTVSNLVIRLPCHLAVALIGKNTTGLVKMSPSYTSSPYFKIDSSLIPVYSETCAKESEAQLLPRITSSENVPLVINQYTVPDEANMPKDDDEEDDLKPVTNTQHQGRCCREILKEMQNLTYLCPDGSSLDLKHDLQKLLTNFKQHIPSENGILVEASKPPEKSNKQSKMKKRKTEKKDYAKLPLHLKLKRKNNDSVDVSSPKKKQTKVIALSDQDISDMLEKEHSMLPNETKLEEEIVEMTMPLAFTSNQVSTQDLIGNFKEMQDSFVEDMQCLPNAPESNTTPQCQELPGKCLIVVDETSPDPETWLTINCPNRPDAKVTLYQASKENILDKKGWLTDSEIHAGQMLLKMEFPLVDGLCNPAVQGDLVTPAISEFIQIINTGAHWICMSTISSGPGTVKIYDTLYNRPNSVAIHHACHMLMYNGDKISFVNERVQRQTNSHDCGLFSILMVLIQRRSPMIKEVCASTTSTVWRLEK